MADAGRLRNLLQQAQGLIADLKSIPLDAESTRASYPRVFELARLVNRLHVAAAALPSGNAMEESTKASWLQRATWLQEDMVALAQERVYAPDSKDLVANILTLLKAGADACDRVLREKAESEMAAAASQQQLKQLQDRLATMEALQHQVSGLTNEAMTAKSQALVLQQQTTQFQQQMAEAARRMQVVEAEAGGLRSRITELEARLKEAQDLADNRVQVIQMLMNKAESGQSVSSQQQLEMLQKEIKQLSGGLESNAQVVAKLIELNTELMEQHNAASAKLAAAKAQNAEQASHALQPQLMNGNVGAEHTVSIGGGLTGQSGHYQGSSQYQYPSQQASTHIPITGPGPPTATAAGSFHAYGNTGSSHSGHVSHGAAAVSTSHSTHKPAAGGSSLADAFALFLADDQKG